MDEKKTIIDLLELEYVPLTEVELTNKLVSDLGFDSLDMNQLMSDIDTIFCIRLSAADFKEKYGIDPTVADIIEYVRLSRRNQ